MSNSFSSQIAKARSLIAHSDFAAISFDVFDTLLIRLGVLPLDILYFMLPKVKEIVPVLDFDFLTVRGKAEDIARAKLMRERPNYGEITLAEIYASLAVDYGLSEGQKEALMCAEIDVEISLLKRNECIAALFEQARKNGKKVLIISDTYLDRDVLERALKANDLGDFTQLYVSSEIKKRKDKGVLFEHVLNAEGLRAGQLLHIGDNPVSDFLMPRRLGISACLLPKALDILQEASALNNNIFKAMIGASIESRLFLGLGVKRLLADHLFPLDRDSLFLGKSFILGYLGIGPFLTGIVHTILQNEMVSKNYYKIHFASRDGFLPLQAYREMSVLWPNALEADYLYCGRRAYDIHKFEASCVDYIIEKSEKNQQDGYSIRNLLDALITPDFGGQENDFSVDVLDGPLYQNLEVLTDFLKKNESRIGGILNEKKQLARAYYGEKLTRNEKGRAVIFDIGYHGSISLGVGRLAACAVDKIYVWQTDENIRIDQAAGTITYALVKDPAKLGSGVLGGNLIFEEVFSSLEPSCIGFKCGETGTDPLFDMMERVPESMRISLLDIQMGAMAFVRDVVSNLGSFLPGISLPNIEELLIPLRLSINKVGSKDISLFAPIVFEDKVFRHDAKSLCDKLIEVPSSFNQIEKNIYMLKRIVAERLPLCVKLYYCAKRIKATIL